ncbi:MAG: TfuA-like protein [Granulosicoccus sp.]
MNIIFAGPTISHLQISQHLDCVCLPPIAHGDILDVLTRSPNAIGIIDGYFEGAPSVWHKEILYAMDQGVRVYGSASMGALRAAELHTFGMIGVGKIFEWYRDGVVEDDDEVAVLHGPAEADYLVASVPMVSIRATLALAQEQDVISADQMASLLLFAKRAFYKTRNWSSILSACDDIFGEGSMGKVLAAWLSKHKVDQKRCDAIQMLKFMRESTTTDSSTREKSYYFQWTNVWDAAVQNHLQSVTEERSLDKSDQKVFDQLCLDSVQYQRYADRALLSRVCQTSGKLQIDEQTLKSSLNRFRAENNLDTRSRLNDYLHETGLKESSLKTLLTNMSRVDIARNSVGILQSDIIDQLKLDGRYIMLLKAASVAEAPVMPAEPDSATSDT